MGNEVQKEINSMLEALGEAPKATETEEETEEVVEEEVPEKKEEGKEETEEETEETEEEPPKKEEGSDKEETEEETEEGEEEPEETEETEEDKDKIIERLRAQLNERSGEPQKKEKLKGEKEEVPPKKEEPPPEEPLQLEEHDFVGDLEPEEVVRDKASFNKLLNAVYAKGVKDARKISTEGVLRSLPEIVKYNLKILTSLKEDSDRFYQENEDLAPYKKVVAAVFEELAAENPDKTYKELMEKVGSEARKRLDLHKKATKSEEKAGKDGKDKPPRLPGKKGGQRQIPREKPNTSSLQRDIDAMNQTLRR